MDGNPEGPLLPELIRPRLRTRVLGRTLYHFHRIDSTNAFAERLLDRGRGAPDGTVVLAEAQTAGRGRLDRAWHSVPESGLYLSIVLRPKIAPSAAPLMRVRREQAPEEASPADRQSLHL
jgi:BirA family biotin operon repressor/biotin-[acetyl-CoA-carboxylase] ligase